MYITFLICTFFLCCIDVVLYKPTPKLTLLVFVLFAVCPPAASGALSEFCQERRWLLFTFSLSWSSTWTRVTRRIQDRSATGYTTDGAPHLPKSRWVTVFFVFILPWQESVCTAVLTLFCVSAGPGSADQKEAGPFVIEWIPDVLPRCHMGELRISFEFGHQQSGQPEYCEKMSAAEKGGRKSDSSQTKHTKAVEILQVVV